MAAVDHEIARLFENYRGTANEDTFIAAFYAAAEERRAELRGLVQGGAARKAVQQRQRSRYPAPLPSTAKTTLEKREAAEKRRKLADFIVHQVPAAFMARLPKCFAARAVLAVICNLCGRARGRCDAAINTIAEMAGCSRSSVNAALRLLQALGLISIVSGQKLGTVSVIRVLGTPLQRLVAFCRARLSGWKRHRASDASAQLSFFEGGVQKNGQKEDSYKYQMFNPVPRNREGGAEGAPVAAN